MDDEIVLNEIVSVQDLRRFENTFNEETRKNCLQRKTQFDYARCLVRSKFFADIRKGLSILENLRETEDLSNNSDILEYLSNLVYGNTRIENYDVALQYADEFLMVEPNNRQVSALKWLIQKKKEDKMRRNMAIVSGSALVLGGIVGALLAIAKLK